MWLKFLIMGHYTYTNTVMVGVLMLMEAVMKLTTGLPNNKTALLLLNKSLHRKPQQGG